MSARIAIVESRAAWLAQFKAIAERLAVAFGPTALRIEHIGSTAVPGLAAKDIVDVQVTVASLDLTADLIERLANAGFVLRDGEWRDHVPPGADPAPDLWLKRYARETQGPEVHVHIRRAGAPNERYARLFRDYLRATPAAAATYAEIKRALAAHHGDDVDAYYEVKDPVCDLIMGAAELWAVASGWDRR